MPFIQFILLHRRSHSFVPSRLPLRAARVRHLITNYSLILDLITVCQFIKSSERQKRTTTATTTTMTASTASDDAITKYSNDETTTFMIASTAVARDAPAVRHYRFAHKFLTLKTVRRNRNRNRRILHTQQSAAMTTI